MDELQKQLKTTLFQERQRLEAMEAYYHYQETLAREIMHRAQDKLVEIDQEKRRIMQNSRDLDCIKKPKSLYQRPFLFLDDEQ